MEMGRKVVTAVVLLIIAMVGCSRALTLCNMTDDGLMACKPSVQQPNPVDPSPACCQAIKGADLPCLCSYKNSYMLPSLGIDPNLALKLPAKCDVPLPQDC